MMDRELFDDDPERVRKRIQQMRSGDWFVFETFAADGSLAIGLAQGDPDPSAVLVVYECLTQEVANNAARGLALWHRRQGRDIAIT